MPFFQVSYTYHRTWGQPGNKKQPLYFFNTGTAQIRHLQKWKMTYLAYKMVCCLKVSAKHFRRISRDRLYFDTHFLALFCHIYSFVVDFNTSYDANVYKLKVQNASHTFVLHE